MSPKLENILGACLVGVMAPLFIYGFVAFPDGPIELCQNVVGFCGKQGQKHSEADYRAYNAWETAMLFVWPTGCAIGAYVGFSKKRKSKSSSTTFSG
jgi:hypothetical protein